MSDTTSDGDTLTEEEYLRMRGLAPAAAPVAPAPTGDTLSPDE